MHPPPAQWEPRYPIIVPVVKVKHNQLNCSRTLPGYFSVFVARFHVSHAVIVRLYMLQSYTVILTGQEDYPSMRKSRALLSPRRRRNLFTYSFYLKCTSPDIKLFTYFFQNCPRNNFLVGNLKLVRWEISEMYTQLSWLLCKFRCTLCKNPRLKFTFESVNIWRTVPTRLIATVK